MTHRARGRQTGAALLAAAVAAAGCSAAGTDKAGDAAPTKPAVLTLAAWDTDYAVANFAAEVARLSGGSLRIKLATSWQSRGDPSGIDHERALVGDVRSGRVPLGIVGVRVWDRLGVPGFRALVAPFLIQSLDVQGQALEGDAGEHALASVSRRGVVGIALLPGFLRRPFGITRPLVRPSDFRGATIGVVPSGVAAATFRALGARSRSYVPGDLAGLDGSELDLLTIVGNGYDTRRRTLTDNVVLWPKPQTIIMNRESFERLQPAERRVLRLAARTAFGLELRRDARVEKRARALLCTDASITLATATAADRAALRRAAAPVYRALEKDAPTRAWIMQIRTLDAKSPGTDGVRCP